LYLLFWPFPGKDICKILYAHFLDVDFSFQKPCRKNRYNGSILTLFRTVPVETEAIQLQLTL